MSSSQTAIKTKRKSKKPKRTKKDWRKYSDVADVEERLAEERTAAIEGYAKKDNSELFFVDKGPDSASTLKKDQVKAKKLYREQVLIPKSGVEGMKAQPAQVNSKYHTFEQQTAKMADKISQGLVSVPDPKANLSKRNQPLPNVTNKRQIKPSAPGKALHLPRANIPDDRALSKRFDLWGEDSPIEPVPHARYRPAPVALPAVEVVPAGASYRPDEEDLQKLKDDALAEITRIKNKEKDLKEKLAPPRHLLTQPRRMMTLEEIEERQRVRNGDEEIDLENEAEDESEADEKPKKHQAYSTRITDSDRNKKLKRKREEYRKLRKERRKEHRGKFDSKVEQSIRELDQSTEEIKRKRQEKEEKAAEDATRTKKLGRYKFRDELKSTIVADAPSSSLRRITPQGNIFADRYLSLHKRNLLETRVKVEKRRRYALRYKLRHNAKIQNDI